MAELQKGDTAPAFETASTDGPLSLEDFRGDWLVLYFYPAAFTPGCTTEACDFRDAAAALGAKVVGVSPDPVEKLLRFKEEHGLSFPLVADEDHELAKAYGAWGTRKLYGKDVTGVRRSTFVIDPEGQVAEAMINVRAKGHVDRVRQALDRLRA